MPVINKSDTMPNENLGFDRNPLTNGGTTRDFASLADFRAFWDFDKGSYPRVVANFAPVEIDETVDANIASQFHIRCNEPGKGRAAAAHAAADRLDIARTDGTGPDPEADPRPFGKVTGAPFVLSDAEAASRIRTISSPAEPPLTGAVPF